MSQPFDKISLFERIGREHAVTAAVDRFYERVLAGPELKDFFNGASFSGLKARQFAFLSQALGGPAQHTRASIRGAHSRLSIEQRHFDGVATRLVETLRDLRVTDEIIGEIGAALTLLSEQIVNTPVRSAVA